MIVLYFNVYYIYKFKIFFEKKIIKFYNFVYKKY